MYTLKINGQEDFKSSEILEIVEKCSGLATGSFTIIESVKQPEAKMSKRDMKKEREDFISILTPAQYNDVHLGIKTPVYSKEIGWHLRFNGVKEQPFYSVKEREAERELAILQACKIQIELMAGEVFEAVKIDFPDIEMSEFRPIFQKILR